MLAELLAAAALLGGAGSPQPAVVWAVGDGADGSAEARRLGDAIARDRPDMFLYLGDVYEHGTSRDFARNYDPLYGALVPITAPTPGNHEWGNRSTGYFPYWKRRLGSGFRSWYARQAGGWQILSLNSEASHGSGSAQLRWLRRQLRGTSGTCRLAFWHRPRFSAGTVHGDQPDVAPLWDTLRGHATLVLGGHDHGSQRFRRRNGIVELVAGAGGGDHYGVNGGDRRLAWSDARDTAAVRIELTPGRARFSFRTADGRVLQSGSAACSPTAP